VKIESLSDSEEIGSILGIMEEGNADYAHRYVSTIDSFKSERWCDACWLLKPLCICSQISPVLSSINIHFSLFLHYKEYKRTSNTGILIKKLFPSSEVFISGLPGDNDRLRNSLSAQANVCVLYPGDKSVDLADWTAKCTAGRMNFVLVDSTWKQGKKLMRELSQFPRVKISPPASSMIKCKKNVNKGYVSTLECAAYLLKELGDNGAYEEVMKAFVLKDKAALKQTHKHALLKQLEEQKHYEIS
jgi:DTW domain-containing protein YfiP